MLAVTFQTDPPSRSTGGPHPTDCTRQCEEPDYVILGTSGDGIVVRWLRGLGAVVYWFSFSICVPRLGGRCPLTAVTVLENSDMRTKRR